jgi:GR25 family glycosyltransferase involved in LPS biosynthesis
VKLEAFIIHLKRAARRGEHARGLAGRLALKAQILDAVDALDMGEEDIAAVYTRSLHRPLYPFELRKSEIACFLSHRKAWQAIVDRGLDAGLVIEDDVEVDDGFAAQLQMAIDMVRPQDYIRFPRWPRGEAGPEVVRKGEGSIIRPELPGLGMQMQLVGREAAIALLAATERFDRPVDTTIQMTWLHGARVLSARPITIREIDLGGSVVQGKNKTFGGRLRREILRPWYRVRLYIYNKMRR